MKSQYQLVDGLGYQIGFDAPFCICFENAISLERYPRRIFNLNSLANARPLKGISLILMLHVTM